MRFVDLSLGALCALGALFLGWHHPLGAILGTGLPLAAAAVTWRWPGTWPAWLLVLLPLVGLAPWTGWLIVEESDLLVLGIAAGAMLRPADHGARHAAASHRTSTPTFGLLLLLMLVFQLSAIWRGLEDAGGFTLGWYQGYREPLNAIRQGKSLLEALLLLRVWQVTRRRVGPVAGQQLRLGLCLSLGAVSLAALWERLLYTGLTNFSTDYRSTALFWEMHVGGAALDGWLSLTFPFALSEWLRARTQLRWTALSLLLALAAYASLTTFSRGVYAAVPLGVALTWWLQSRQVQLGAAGPVSPKRRAELAAGTVLVAAALAAALAMFPTSGYRGLMALLCTCLVCLFMAPQLNRLATPHAIGATVLACALALLGWFATAHVPKGAYGYFALVGMASLLFALRLHRPAGDVSAKHLQFAGLACLLALIPGVGLVALHWGGTEGGMASVPVMAGLGLTCIATLLAPRPLWPRRLRWQGTVSVLMVLGSFVIVTFGGGAYMSGRFTTSSNDLDGRQAHWEHGLSLLDDTAQWLLGKGSGRYVDHHALTAARGQRPGDYRLRQDASQSHLSLIGGTHAMSWGELLRISQRVDQPASGPVQVRFDARTDALTEVHVEICIKHLLYDAACTVKSTNVKPTQGHWQDHNVVLDASRLPVSNWPWRRFVVFSIATTNAQTMLDLDRLSAMDGNGQEMLTNGDFSEGLARWFFSSDRNHMPWHMKNMLLHVVFEQGLLGAAALLAMLGFVALRVLFGSAHHHALAPGLLGGLLGFLVVGAFDSLLDVPRLALLFYFLLMVGGGITHQHSVPSASPQRAL